MKTSIAAGLLLLTTQAWAVTGNAELTLTDSTGDPVPNATVSLGGQTGVTDSQGRVTLADVPEGDHELIVEDQVVGKGPRRVAVVGGKTTSERVTTVPRRAWMGAHPARLGGVGAGVGTSSISFDDMTATRIVDVITATTGGTTAPPVVSQLTGSALGSLNQSADFSFDADFRTVDVPVGLGNYGDGPVFFPGVVLVGGNANVDFDLPPSNFDDDGSVAGGGVSMILMGGGGTHHVEVLGKRWKTDEIGVNRNPPATFDSDDVQIEYTHEEYGAIYGYSPFTWFTLRAGAVAFKGKVHKTGRIFIDAGGGSTTTDQFVNDFEEDGVMGVLGADFGAPRTPIFGRVQYSGDGDNDVVSVTAVWSFGI